MPDLPYKEEHTLEQRKASSASIRAKHPDRVPVIVVRARATRSLRANPCACAVSLCGTKSKSTNAKRRKVVALRCQEMRR